MAIQETLPQSPKFISDISILEQALESLKIKESETGKPYVFEYVQQPMIGGTCYLTPQEIEVKSENGCYLLGRFDRKYFTNRIKELKKSSKYKQSTVNSNTN